MAFFMDGRNAEYATADATTRHEDVTVECRANNSMPGRKEDAVTCPYTDDPVKTTVAAHGRWLLDAGFGNLVPTFGESMYTDLLLS